MPKRIDDDDYIVVRDIADDGPEDEGRAVNAPGSWFSYWFSYGLTI